MSDDVYSKLREFLDNFPIGFPKTESGVEMKILRKLYTEEEAKIAVLLPPTPTKAVSIARRHKLDPKYLKDMLESMAKKALIFRVRRGGKTLYNAPPFMIGIYEYSVEKLDAELAKLYKEYYDTIYVNEIAEPNIPGFKVIPIEETIKTGTVLYPYQKLKESIKQARKISVAECICRKEARLTGKVCDRPTGNCLSFGVAAEFYIENGLGREISADEAIEIIKEADDAGLVHAGANSKHLSNICNCCPCCCVSLKPISKLGFEKGQFMNAIFEAIIDSELCVGCGTCIDRCPVDAIAVDDVAIVDRSRCLGCGLCASVCPEEAITLLPREDIEEPYGRILELAQAIIETKKKQKP